MTVPLPAPPPLDLSRDALFLDFDGTLVELAERPDAVVVSEALIDRLCRLSIALDGRLALVSGRAIAVLDEFGLATLAAAGSHGAERRLAGGSVDAPPPPDGLPEIARACAAFAGARAGVIFEEKPLGAGLHYRNAPDEESAARALAETLAERWNLHIQHGHKMVELRCARMSKGDAIAAFLADKPFAGHRPVFIGDDVTDEHGFVAVSRHGGHGVLVGEPRASAARFGLSDVVAVNDWLAAALINR